MTPRALHRFVVFTAAVTFCLLGAGGLVTSHGVGMAVPDWPNTFGYNMFFFPFSQWVGGVFYEHSHRLIASGAGLCTTILAVWLYGTKARSFLRWCGAALLLLGGVTVAIVPQHWSDAVVLGLTGAAALVGGLVWPRSEPAPSWLRWLGLAAFLAVVLQGVLGGLRVVLFKDQIGIFHAALAQIFFATTCALALVTSPWWEQRFRSPWDASINPRQPNPRSLGLVASSRLAWVCLGATALILVQLVLGAAMRHQHAGLAIPDFPLAYGKLWPAMDPQSVAHYNQQRVEVVDLKPITAIQIALQMAHRLVAVGIFAAISFAAWWARRESRRNPMVSRLALGWLLLILIQALLGAATIWSNKAADVATAHVLVGALCLVVGTSLSMVLFQQIGLTRLSSPAIVPSTIPANGSLGVRPSPALGFES